MKTFARSLIFTIGFASGVAFALQPGPLGEATLELNAGLAGAARAQDASAVKEVIVAQDTVAAFQKERSKIDAGEKAQQEAFMRRMMGMAGMMKETARRINDRYPTTSDKVFAIGKNVSFANLLGTLFQETPLMGNMGRELVTIKRLLDLLDAKNLTLTNEQKAELFRLIEEFYATGVGSDDAKKKLSSEKLATLDGKAALSKLVDKLWSYKQPNMTRDAFREQLAATLNGLHKDFGGDDYARLKFEDATERLGRAGGLAGDRIAAAGGPADDVVRFVTSRGVNADERARDESLSGGSGAKGRASGRTDYIAGDFGSLGAPVGGVGGGTAIGGDFARGSEGIATGGDDGFLAGSGAERVARHDDPRVSGNDRGIASNGGDHSEGGGDHAAAPPAQGAPPAETPPTKNTPVPSAPESEKHSAEDPTTRDPDELLRDTPTGDEALRGIRNREKINDDAEQVARRTLTGGGGSHSSGGGQGPGPGLGDVGTGGDTGGGAGTGGGGHTGSRPSDVFDDPIMRKYVSMFDEYQNKARRGGGGYGDNRPGNETLPHMTKLYDAIKAEIRKHTSAGNEEARKAAIDDLMQVSRMVERCVPKKTAESCISAMRQTFTSERKTFDAEVALDCQAQLSAFLVIQQRYASQNPELEVDTDFKTGLERLNAFRSAKGQPPISTTNPDTWTGPAFQLERLMRDPECGALPFTGGRYRPVGAVFKHEQKDGLNCLSFNERNGGGIVAQGITQMLATQTADWVNAMTTKSKNRPALIDPYDNASLASFADPAHLNDKDGPHPLANVVMNVMSCPLKPGSVRDAIYKSFIIDSMKAVSDYGCNLRKIYDEAKGHFADDVAFTAHLARPDICSKFPADAKDRRDLVQRFRTAIFALRSTEAMSLKEGLLYSKHNVFEAADKVLAGKMTFADAKYSLTQKKVVGDLNSDRVDTFSRTATGMVSTFTNGISSLNPWGKSAEPTPAQHSAPQRNLASQPAPPAPAAPPPRSPSAPRACTRPFTAVPTNFKVSGADPAVTLHDKLRGFAGSVSGPDRRLAEIAELLGSTVTENCNCLSFAEPQMAKWGGSNANSAEAEASRFQYQIYDTLLSEHDQLNAIRLRTNRKLAETAPSALQGYFDTAIGRTVDIGGADQPKVKALTEPQKRGLNLVLQCRRPETGYGQYLLHQERTLRNFVSEQCRDPVAVQIAQSAKEPATPQAISKKLKDGANKQAAFQGSAAEPFVGHKELSSGTAGVPWARIVQGHGATKDKLCPALQRRYRLVVGLISSSESLVAAWGEGVYDVQQGREIRVPASHR